MAFRSDIDLSKLHKSKMDQEMSYGLSWHYNRMLMQQQQEYKADLERIKNNKLKSNDVNNNFNTKATEMSDDLFNCLMPHRGKSGTWP
jgi:hypothetical protein